MNSSTSMERNMIAGHLTATGKKELLQKEKVIESTLYEEIYKRVKQLNKNRTFIDISIKDSISRSDLHDEKDFTVPEFSKEFMTYDRRKYYSNTQKWVGHILEIKEDLIIAKLNDINNPTTYEIAEFEKREIPFEDRELISIGAGFYWSLGYANDNGQIEKKSLIRFQRTKEWEEKDVDNIVDDVEDLYNKLKKWD